MVRVEPFHYTGKVWCLKVPTGCFVAWRDGMAFPTGNSGFPKSLDVSKAIDKVAGVEREVVGEGPNASRRPNAGAGVTIHMPSGDPITAPATPEAQQWAGFGTALKPALEPITMARKPLQGTVAANVLAHGTGGLNVDRCRVATGDSLGGGGATTAVSEGWDRPFRHDPVAIELLKKTTTEKIAKAETLGRWPANLIHDGSDEVVGLFPQAQGMQKAILRRGATTGLAMGAHGIYGEMQPMNAEAGYGDTGSAARFFYTAKASKSDRDKDNKHPTVKPTDLMRYLCRLVTPPGGIVLDPFMGSGSTGKGALLEGFVFIGIEREEESHATAEARLSRVASAGHQLGLGL